MTTPSPVPEQSEREELTAALVNLDVHARVPDHGCDGSTTSCAQTCPVERWLSPAEVAEDLIAAGWSRHPRPATVSEVDVEAIRKRCIEWLDRDDPALSLARQIIGDDVADLIDAHLAAQSAPAPRPERDVKAEALREAADAIERTQPLFTSDLVVDGQARAKGAATHLRKRARAIESEPLR